MANKKKTTIVIDVDLLTKLEELSKSDNRNVNNTIETILQDFFKRRPKVKSISDCYSSARAIDKIIKAKLKLSDFEQWCGLKISSGQGDNFQVWYYEVDAFINEKLNKKDENRKN
jgi:hypothetical protein